MEHFPCTKREGASLQDFLSLLVVIRTPSFSHNNVFRQYQNCFDRRGNKYISRHNI